jgi:hypothetical protein
MSLTTKSPSVPVVLAIRLAIGAPAILTGAVRRRVVKVSTSGRVEASRWSLTSQLRHWSASPSARRWIGRCTKGIGFAGSEM